MSKLLFKSFILFIFFIIASCEKAPDYSDTPSISFNKLSQTKEFDQGLQAQVDKISIDINFQDGDGDLGVDQDDLSKEPYRSDNNYLVTVYKKTGSVFIVDTTLNFNGNYPVLTEKSHKGPIDGTLSWQVIFPSPLLPAKSEYKFSIKIKDRKMHVSNIAETPSFRIN